MGRCLTVAEDARVVLAEAMDEAALQAGVESRLRDYGWLWYHTRRSTGSAKGFPDLCAVRRGQLVFIELKREGKQPTPEQHAWLKELARCQVRVCLWRPAHLFDGTVDEVLR